MLVFGLRGLWLGATQEASSDRVAALITNGRTSRADGEVMLTLLKQPAERQSS